MDWLRVRLDLIAVVLIFAQLISADTYALPPMTSMYNIFILSLIINSRYKCR